MIQSNKGMGMIGMSTGQEKNLVEQSVEQSIGARQAGLVRQEIQDGLLAAQARISPKFFYDELGSSLFTSICRLQEYYPTRTEAAIFEGNALAIAAHIRSNTGPIESLIDLGAGDCQKAASLFKPLKPKRYFAVDVSETFVTDAVRKLAAEFPTIQMQALGRDLSQHWELPAACPDTGRVFFYPGSSIGNFAPPEAISFLKRLIEACSEPCSLLIGIDLVKPTEILEPAYDDALGITGAFNLNVLNHVNRLINADFDVRDWRHVAFFNRPSSRIEMHLEARRTVDVAWPTGARQFVAGDRIQTEYSYKYEEASFRKLLRESGFITEQCWTDEKRWFGVFLARSV
jgi:dimethylhistidine N-methyltransferase